MLDQEWSKWVVRDQDQSELVYGDQSRGRGIKYVCIEPPLDVATFMCEKTGRLMKWRQWVLMQVFRLSLVQSGAGAWGEVGPLRLFCTDGVGLALPGNCDSPSATSNCAHLEGHLLTE